MLEKYKNCVLKASDDVCTMCAWVKCKRRHQGPIDKVTKGLVYDKNY